MAYISVTDAVERTGKGQTTIYRFCRKFEHTRHVKREDKKFLIDEEFLSKHLAADSEQAENGKAEKPKQELIDFFIEELLNEKRYYRLLLDRKDDQLERKDSMISSLQERQKELHYLLNHQTQLLESFRKPESEISSQEDTEEVNKEQVKRETEANTKPDKMAEQVRIVYAVLALVGFLLVLAIIFVDEIKAVV